MDGSREGEIVSSEFAEDLKTFFPDLLRREFGNKIRKDIRPEKP